jgi:predicted peptidase
MARSLPAALCLLGVLALLPLAGCAAGRSTASNPSPMTAPPSSTASTTPSTAPAAPQTGLLFRQAVAGGLATKYAVYLPREYGTDPAKRWPLLVFLHGRGECGTEGVRQTAVGLGPAVLIQPDKWPFVILMPQKPDPARQWAEYEPMVLDLLRATATEFNTDPQRTYLTGLSQGGAGTWAIGSKHPQLFAALAPVCGYGDAPALAPGLVGKPIWTLHGEKDDVVPPERTRVIVSAVQAAAGPDRAGLLKATYLPDANHNSWDAAYRQFDLGAWLLSHRLDR